MGRFEKLISKQYREKINYFFLHFFPCVALGCAKNHTWNEKNKRMYWKKTSVTSKTGGQWHWSLFSVYTFNGNCGRTPKVATGLRFGRPGFDSQRRKGIFFSTQYPCWFWRPSAADTGAFFPGNKAAAAWDLPLILIYCRGQECVELHVQNSVRLYGSMFN
jgi:hypothetical protein